MSSLLRVALLWCLVCLSAPAARAQGGTQVVFTMGQLEVMSRQDDTNVTITNLQSGATWASFNMASEGQRQEWLTGVPHYIGVSADKPLTLFSGKALAGSNDWGSLLVADNNTEFGEHFHGFTEYWVWVFMPREAGDTRPSQVSIQDLSDGDDTVTLTGRDATLLTPTMEVWERPSFDHDTIQVDCNRPCEVEVGSSSIKSSTGWAITPPSIAKGEDGRELGTKFAFFAHPDLTIWPFTDGTDVQITDLSDDDDTQEVHLNSDQVFSLRDLTGVSQGERSVVTAGGNLFDSDFVEIESNYPILVYNGANYDPGGGFILDFASTVPTGPAKQEAFAYANGEGLILLAHDASTTVTLDTVTGNTSHALTVDSNTWSGVGPYYWQGASDWSRELVHVTADKPISVFYGDFTSSYYGGCCSASFVPVVPETATLPPVAEAGVSVIACPYDTIQFDGTASYDQDGVGPEPDIVAYKWDFDTNTNSDGFGGRDDDTDSDQAIGTWTYPASDTYSVRLTVTDNDGETDDDYVQVVIDVSDISLCGTDDDQDGVGSNNDNCPDVFNPDQADANGNGIGDACDPDLDGDGVDNTSDNCPNTANPDQANHDSDGLGDACDTDDDGDGVADTADNCPLLANPNQADADSDGIGDACDTDDDGDGVSDATDNCPLVANPDQANTDGTGGGDACDDDADGDGVSNASDNCPLVANPDQANLDADAQGDACDLDDDGDGVPDTVDDCPATSDLPQVDTDGDGIGDACDDDIDGDGVSNATDDCPLVANADQADADRDGQGDVCDGDQDGDGVPDATDDCPTVADADQADFDSDGIGDACDPDADDDAVLDYDDNCPLLANHVQTDTDGDGQGDACDEDDDGDGIPDATDNCPVTPNADQADDDGDGVGNACSDHVSYLSGPCGCQTTPTPGAAWSLLLLLGLVRRRRRALRR